MQVTVSITVSLLGSLSLCSALQTAFVPTTVNQAFFKVRKPLTKEEAISVVDHQLFPIDDNISRFEASAIFGVATPEASEDSDDTEPNFLECTYGEFPLESLDELLDASLNYIKKEDKETDNINMMDIGSGCGRLSIYTSLRRPGWQVGGIEIAPALHQQAIVAADTVIKQGLIEPCDDTVDDASFIEDYVSLLSLHAGSVNKNAELLQEIDLLFCYSTAFETDDYNDAIGAAILSEEWNTVLTDNCKEGCVVITTDCALDPSLGWTLLKEIDVPNPDVIDSTGFIQRLDRK